MKHRVLVLECKDKTNSQIHQAISQILHVGGVEKIIGQLFCRLENSVYFCNTIEQGTWFFHASQILHTNNRHTHLCIRLDTDGTS